MDFILHEAITEGTLPNTLDSCMEYWLEVVRWVQYLALWPPGVSSLFSVFRSGPLRKQLRRKARQLAREHNRRVLEARGEDEDELEEAEDELEEADHELEEASS